MDDYNSLSKFLKNNISKNKNQSFETRWYTSNFEKLQFYHTFLVQLSHHFHVFALQLSFLNIYLFRFVLAFANRNWDMLPWNFSHKCWTTLLRNSLRCTILRTISIIWILSICSQSILLFECYLIKCL